MLQQTSGIMMNAPQTHSLEWVKWDYVRRVMAESNGNVSEAARRLRLHRRSLQRMLRKPPPVS